MTSDETDADPHPRGEATTTAPLTADELRRGSPDRVIALTDGVFAIIVTLLVLEIAVPANLGEASLREALDELRPTLLAWVISFLITGMYWVMHRDLFARIRIVNRDLVWLNLLFLLSASLIPFVSSVLGEYPDEPVALHIYGFVVITLTAMRVVMFGYVIRRPRLLWEPPSDRTGLVMAIAAAPMVFYVIAMAVAAASPTASIVFFFASPLAYFLLISLLRERPRTRSEVEEFS